MAIVIPVKRLFTPLLRRIYCAFAIFCAVYYAFPPIQRSAWNKDRLYKRMLAGDKLEKGAAAADLAAIGAQDVLLKALKSDSDTTREMAANALMDLWFNASGDQALTLLQASGQALEQHEFVEAMAILSRLVETYPFYAEGWNRRATVYWQLGNVERAVADCKKVVLLNPNHFAAWQSLGLGYMRLNDLPNAVKAFKSALRVIPHDRATRSYLRRCEDMQRRFRPQREPEGEMV